MIGVYPWSPRHSFMYCHQTKIHLCQSVVTFCNRTKTLILVQLEFGVLKLCKHGDKYNCAAKKTKRANAYCSQIQNLNKLAADCCCRKMPSKVFINDSKLELKHVFFFFFYCNGVTLNKITDCWLARWSCLLLYKIENLLHFFQHLVF